MCKGRNCRSLSVRLRRCASGRGICKVAGISGTSITLVDGGRLHYARLTNDDDRAMVVRNESPVRGESALHWYTLPTTGGTLSAMRGTNGATIAANAYFMR